MKGQMKGQMNWLETRINKPVSALYEYFTKNLH